MISQTASRPAWRQCPLPSPSSSPAAKVTKERWRASGVKESSCASWLRMYNMLKTTNRSSHSLTEISPQLGPDDQTVHKRSKRPRMTSTTRSVPCSRQDVGGFDLKKSIRTESTDKADAGSSGLPKSAVLAVFKSSSCTSNLQYSWLFQRDGCAKMRHGAAGSHEEVSGGHELILRFDIQGPSTR